jgi:hypothetical protein
MVRAEHMANRTKGSASYRGYAIDFETEENNGLWETTARFQSRKGSLGITIYSEGVKGFTSKEQAEDATIRWVKQWIDENLPESPRP